MTALGDKIVTGQDSDGLVARMSGIDDIDAVVFDVLGTMVDERTGLRTAIAEVAPGLDDLALGVLLDVWQDHVEAAQQAIEHRHRGYVSSDTIDAEAAAHVAQRAGITDAATIAHLSTAGSRLPAWADSQGGLDLIANRSPVLGLSNASHRSLLRLNAHAGLRWH
ncbi:MAG: hypothetical protein L0K86_24265, partial [Actinomycetia bacterium]|nr:hypothetical protein [Actinomycetes bacterium]